MAVPVWKCEHCSHFEKVEKDIYFHEDKCSFNPSTKSCYTCKHRYQEEWSDADGCRLEVREDFFHPKNCEFWEWEVEPTEENKGESLGRDLKIL